MSTVEVMASSPFLPHGEQHHQSQHTPSTCESCRKVHRLDLQELELDQS